MIHTLQRAASVFLAAILLSGALPVIAQGPGDGEPFGLVIRMEGDRSWGSSLVNEYWLAPENGTPRYELLMETTATTVQTCHYSVTGSPDSFDVTRRQLDVTATLTDLQTGEVLGREQLMGRRPNSCAPIASNPHVIWGVPDPQVFLDWFGPLVEATADLPSAPFTVLGDSFTALALSADGTLLAAADFESADLNIWDLQSGEMLLDIEVGPMGAGNGLHFSRDGTRLLTAGDGVYAYLLDTHSGEVLLRFGLDRDGVVTDARFSPDEQIVATSGRDVRLWDANSGDLLQTFAPSDMAQSVRFNAAGTQLLTASGSRAYIWDIESGEHVVVFEGHQDYVERAIFSPDETQIATIGWDRIRIWDVATGDELARCTGGEEEEKFTLAYSPDGVYLASGSFLTLRLLDAATCEQITALERDDTRDMVFSPDGLRLIVSGYSGITTYYVADLLETTDE